ncbi:MAG: orotidine 5'-phosphate decarboxylase, partial [Bacteroidota bacterium]
HFLLVPGVGAQGGSLQEVCRFGFNKDCGLLINASRSIIYASSEDANFEHKVESAAKEMQAEMEQILVEKGF